MSSPQNLRAVGDRIEELVGQLRSALDPVTWRMVEEALSLVTDLYGAGLAATVRTLKTDDRAGPAMLARLVDDELVASLLVLHGLHPRDLADRVDAALVGVRPYLASHGGDVEVLDLDPDAGALRLRLLGSCDGCPSSVATLRHSVELAIAEAAPEIVIIEVEGLAEPAAPPPPPATPIKLSVKPTVAAGVSS
ncbi:MAG: NifU family protein [Acidimicrobiales bacterium]